MHLYLLGRIFRIWHQSFSFAWAQWLCKSENFLVGILYPNLLLLSFYKIFSFSELRFEKSQVLPYQASSWIDLFAPACPKIFHSVLFLSLLLISLYKFYVSLFLFDIILFTYCFCFRFSISFPRGVCIFWALFSFHFINKKFHFLLKKLFVFVFLNIYHDLSLLEAFFPSFYFCNLLTREKSALLLLHYACYECYDYCFLS